MLLLKPRVTQELKLEQIIWLITRLIVINIEASTELFLQLPAVL